MIKVVTKEYMEGVLVVRTIVVTFLSIPIFKSKKTTTHQMVVRQFAPVKEKIQLKGFNYETENKSKSID
jgi:hypothetical protein